jgi:hypothetical protein
MKWICPIKKTISHAFFWRDIYIAKIATVAVTLQTVYCCGPGRTSGPFVFKGRAFGLVPGNKKNLGRISGRLHFLAQNQVTTQAVKAIYSQESYWKESFILPQSDMSRCFLKRPHGLRVERAKKSPRGPTTTSRGLLKRNYGESES